MNKLTNLCLRKPVSTVIIILALIIFGFASVTGMNMQLTPDMELPMIIVFTIYPQAGPEEVDRLVSQELEDVGATIEGLDGVTSRSMENMSYMIYSFDYGTDIDKAYTDLQQEIDAIKPNLPEDCNDPVLIIMDINAMQSMTLSVTSKSGADVRSFVEKTLDPEISSVANVASTSVTGGKSDYISITVDQNKMAEYGLDMATLASYVGSADFSIPAGSVEMGSQTLNVNAKVEYDGLYDLENIPVLTSKGSTIRLGDVADVHYAQEEADSISRYNGQENVTLDITKQQGSNAVQLSKDVIRKIETISEKYPDMEIEVIYDSSTSIISSLTSVGETLVLGVFLSMFVLFVFFGDIKASLIVGSSMPVSLLVTVLLMYACGFSLNIVTMGAMVIGIGMMVDNSIVVLEMCFQKRDAGLGFRESAADAVKTVAMSVTASTITTVVVYLPLALLKGLSGQIFGQLGFTIIFSLTASLIASVTLVPLCFSKYHPIEKKNFIVSRGVRSLANVYGKFMEKLLNKKFLVILVTVILVGITVWLASMLNTELMPSTDEGTVQIDINVKPGLGLEAKDEILVKLEEFVAADPDVNSYNVSTSKGSSTISVSAYLKSDRSRKTIRVVDEWNEALADWQNIEAVCSSSSSTSMSSGMNVTAKEIDLEAAEMSMLAPVANGLMEKIREVDGVSSVTTSIADAASKAEIIIDPLKATAAGVLPVQAASAIYTAKNGIEAMDLIINEKEYSVNIENAQGQYDDINNLMNMTVPSNFGTMVPISDIAEVVYTDSPQIIYRSDGYYQVSVTAYLNSDTVFETSDLIDQVVAEYPMPNGVSLAESMYTEMVTEELVSILKAILIALWLVFMVMTMQFESARYAGLIMFCIPFSLIGSVLLLLLTNSTLSMTSMMGFLMLEGIVVNNGILMIDTTNQFREEGLDSKNALVEAGKSRLRPILMTTLTTILSMIPMSLGIGSNAQMMQSMSVVIVGGLVASTILTLILLPTLYLILAKRDKKDKVKANIEEASA